MVDTHKKCLNSVRYWKTICLTINGKHPKPSSEKNAIGICNGIGQTRDNAAYRIRISIWELWDRRVFTEMLKKFSQEKDKEGWKQEYTARKQRRNEGPRKYCTDKLEYGYKHMLQPRGAWESSRMQWSWDCLTWSWREHACSSCLRYCNMVRIICFFKINYFLHYCLLVMFEIKK